MDRVRTDDGASGSGIEGISSTDITAKLYLDEVRAFSQAIFTAHVCSFKFHLDYGGQSYSLMRGQVSRSSRDQTPVLGFQEAQLYDRSDSPRLKELRSAGNLSAAA
jgi:hypothetical protein